MRFHFLSIVILCVALSSCGEDPKPDGDIIITPPIKLEPLNAQEFNEDSALSYIQAQVDFGPRVPNTLEHDKCAAYLSGFLRNQGLEVIEQKGQVKAFNGSQLNINNVIGQYNLDAEKRILLFAHWDTRPFADRDSKDVNKPIDGANDGASGVGVLMEVARQLALTKPNIGVDIIFFDAEDYGQPSVSMSAEEDTWCLGTQFWTRSPHVPGYKAEFGILLDMVGARGATFPLEGTSKKYAPQVQADIWHIAKRLGHTHLFSDKVTGETIDDHLYVNRDFGIPSVNIVHYDPNRRDYFPFHHKHGDSMDKIDKTVLKAVGEVVLSTIVLKAEESTNP